MRPKPDFRGIFFASSKSRTQFWDSIPGLAFFNPEVPGLEKKSGIEIPTGN